MISAALEANFPAIVGIVVLIGLAGLRFAVLYARSDADFSNPPMEKRTHLFETADGKRYNPFSDLTPVEAGETRTICPVCDHTNEAWHSYCSDCTTRLPP